MLTTLKNKQRFLSIEKLCPKDADGMVNSVDPDQTVSTILIWVCTDCQGLSVRKLRIIMDILYRNDPKFSDRQVWANSGDQIRLLLMEQSDQGLHCLLFYLHILNTFLYGKTSLFEF